MNTNLILLICLITIMYILINCLHRYLLFKSQSYLNFIAKHNITVKFLYVSLQTKAFNRMIYKISHVNLPKKCHCVKYTLIYNMGVVFTILSIPVSVYIIGQSVYSNLEKPQCSSLYSTSDNEEHYINVKPLVIGVNLPMSHLLYYILSLLICIIVHELGHAVCAIHENIRLNHIGIVVVFILPVIYVDTENINCPQVPISLLAKLRIFCAGIWHNVFLTLIMYLILYTFPIAISPLFASEQGVQLTHVASDSPLKPSTGKLGLEPFDVIYQINECRVLNEATYKQCLLSAGKQRKGYCLSDEFVEKHNENLNNSDKSEECCVSSQSKHLCFVQIVNGTNSTPDDVESNRKKRQIVSDVNQSQKQNEIGILTVKSAHLQEISSNKQLTESGTKPLKYCMQARLVIDSISQTCSNSDQCQESLCYFPHISHSLIQIHVRHKPTYVLYLGRPNDVHTTISVSHYVQKYTKSVMLSYVPTIGYNMAVYISILSSGLALVNAVPCYYSDSHHIVAVLVTRAYLRVFIQAASTVMLCVYFLLFIPSTLFGTPMKR